MWEKEAIRALLTLRSPKEFGPRMRRPDPLASSVIRRCRASPSAPISEKPALKITATLTPLATHCSSASNTNAAGILMIAISTSSGTSRSVG